MSNCTPATVSYKKFWNEFSASKAQEQASFFNHCLNPTYILTTGNYLGNIKTMITTEQDSINTMSDALINLSTNSGDQEKLFFNAPLIYNYLDFEGTDGANRDDQAIQWYLDQYNDTRLDQVMTKDNFKALFPCWDKGMTMSIDGNKVSDLYSIRKRATMIPLTQLPVFNHSDGTTNFITAQFMTPTNALTQKADGCTLFLAGNNFAAPKKLSMKLPNGKQLTDNSTAFGVLLCNTFNLKGNGTTIKDLFVPNNSIKTIDSNIFTQAKDPEECLANDDDQPKPTSYERGSYGIMPNLTLQTIHIGNDRTKSNCNTCSISNTLFNPKPVGTLACDYALEYLNVSGLTIDPGSTQLLTLPPCATNLKCFTANNMQGVAGATWSLSNKSTTSTNFSYMIRGDVDTATGLKLSSIEDNTPNYTIFDLPYNSIDLDTTSYVTNTLGKANSTLTYLDLSYQTKNPKTPLSLTLSASLLKTCKLSQCAISSFSVQSAPILETLCLRTNPFTSFTLSNPIPKLTDIDISYPNPNNQIDCPPTSPKTSCFGSLKTLSLNLDQIPSLQTLAATNHQITTCTFSGNTQNTSNISIDLSFNLLLARTSSLKTTTKPRITTLKLNGNTPHVQGSTYTPYFTGLQLPANLQNLYLYGSCFGTSSSQITQSLIKFPTAPTQKSTTYYYADQPSSITLINRMLVEKKWKVNGTRCAPDCPPKKATEQCNPQNCYANPKSL